MYDIAPHSQNHYYRNLSNMKRHCVTYYIAPLAKSEESLSSPGSREENGQGTYITTRYVIYIADKGIRPQDYFKQYNFSNNFNLHYFHTLRDKHGV